MTTIDENTLKAKYRQMIGLINVDNTSDKNKIISDSTQNALNTKLNLSGGILTGGLTGTTAIFTNGITCSTGTFSNTVNFNGGINAKTATFSNTVNFNGGFIGTTGTFTNLVNFNGGLTGSSANFSGSVSSNGAILTGGITGTTAVFSGSVISNGRILTGGLTGTTATFSGDVISNTSDTAISMTSLLTQLQTTQTLASSNNLVNLSSYISDSDAFFNGIVVNGMYLKNTYVSVLKNGYNPIYKFSNSLISSLKSSTPPSSYTNLINSDVTFETWIYPMWMNNSVQYDMIIFDNRSSSNLTNGFALGIYKNASNNYALPYIYSNDGTDRINIPSITGPTTMLNNSWNHIAYIIDKINSQVKAYLNGTECTTYNYYPNYTTIGSWNSITIGSTVDDLKKFNGYIGSVKISNTILYTSTFNPDAYFTSSLSTSYLLINNYNYISSLNTLSLTVNGTVTNSLQINSCLSKGFKIGTTRYFIMNGPFNDLQNNGWTIEFWLYVQTSGNVIIIQFDTNFIISLNISKNVIFNGPSSYSLTSSNTVTLNSWTHIALVRIGTTAYLYVNGILTLGAATLNLSSIIPSSLIIGNSLFNGYISQVHVSKRVLYSANFTPQISLFPTDISTSIFLLSSNEMSINSNIIDIISGNKLGVINVNDIDF